MERKIAPVIHIRKLGEPDSDFEYWQGQSYEARISALEEMRQGYYAWLALRQGKPEDAGPGIRKFCRVIKLKDLNSDN